MSPFSFDNADQVIAASTGLSGGTCSSGPNPFTYDQAGQFLSTTTGSTFHATYNAALATTSLTHPGGNPVSYGYSDLGNTIRVTGTIPATGATFGYANGPLGVQARTVTGSAGGTDDGTTYYTRDPGGGLIDEHGGPAGTDVYVTDAQGSVVALYGAKTAAGTAINTTVATYTYSPDGNSDSVTTVSGTGAFPDVANENTFRYISGYYDGIEGDGYYHLGARYYGRGSNFNQPDPAHADPNLYNYADGDPVNAKDPSGLFCLDANVGFFDGGYCDNSGFYGGVGPAAGAGVTLSGDGLDDEAGPTGQYASCEVVPGAGFSFTEQLKSGLSGLLGNGPITTLRSVGVGFACGLYN